MDTRVDILLYPRYVIIIWTEFILNKIWQIPVSLEVMNFLEKLTHNLWISKQTKRYVQHYF